MKIVVTGATSFVGLGAVRELISRGHHVYAVLRENSTKTELLKQNEQFPTNLTVLYEDLGNLNRLPDKISEKCDVFIHMGWRGAGSDSRKNESVQEESVLDALNAVRVAKKLGCRRFLFTGSQAEYGIKSTLTDEEAVCEPTSPYGKAKLKVRYEAELLCKELGLDYGHARIFSTYGPGDHPWSLISSCVRTFKAGDKMTMTACTQQWNFMYIDDAGRALTDLAEYAGNLSEHGPVYNLGGPMDETGELRGFVEKVYELCGKCGSMEFGVRQPNAEGIVNLIPDIRKMERVIGWKPQVHFEEGMKRILDSIK